MAARIQGFRSLSVMLHGNNTFEQVGLLRFQRLELFALEMARNRNEYIIQFNK
jgi:hypothetical protein